MITPEQEILNLSIAIGVMGAALILACIQALRYSAKYQVLKHELEEDDTDPNKAQTITTLYPKTHLIIKSVVVINNRTDAQYTYESKNCFGLNTVVHRNDVIGHMVIEQRHDFNEELTETYLASFTDFSILSFTTEEVDDIHRFQLHDKAHYYRDGSHPFYNPDKPKTNMVEVEITQENLEDTILNHHLYKRIK